MNWLIGQEPTVRIRQKSGAGITEKGFMKVYWARLRNLTKTLFALLCAMGLTLSLSCAKSNSGASASSSKSITLRWNANKEVLVNSALGGYKVYMGYTSSFVPSPTNLVATITYNQPREYKLPPLASGTKVYFKVVAYSLLYDSPPSDVYMVTAP